MTPQDPSQQQDPEPKLQSHLRQTSSWNPWTPRSSSFMHGQDQSSVLQLGLEFGFNPKKSVCPTWVPGTAPDASGVLSRGAHSNLMQDSDPMDCSLPGSSTHGILQARVLEWSAIAFSEFLTNYF